MNFLATLYCGIRTEIDLRLGMKYISAPLIAFTVRRKYNYTGRKANYLFPGLTLKSLLAPVHTFKPRPHSSPLRMSPSS
jgi:hypothetical protein